MSASSYLDFEKHHLAKVLYAAKSRLDHLPRAQRREQQHDIHRAVLKLFRDIRENWPAFQHKQNEVIDQILEAVS